MLIRLIGEIESPGIYEFNDAKKLANELELDLVLISDKSDYPLYRIFNEEKFLYEQKKKDQEQKKAQKNNVIKELKLSPNIEDNDFNVKLNQAKEFHKKQFKLKITLTFNGRTIQFKEIGERIMLKFISDLDKYYKPDKYPTIDGKRMQVNLIPIKK